MLRGSTFGENDMRKGRTWEPAPARGIKGSCGDFGTEMSELDIRARLFCDGAYHEAIATCWNEIPSRAVVRIDCGRLEWRHSCGRFIVSNMNNSWHSDRTLVNCV